ncbi:MAG: hypothetical protein M0Z85_07595 [Gammaproteobacteria bacterium]|nr:hypothetical protein [Gammaproteobacteria bacterium]
MSLRRESDQRAHETDIPVQVMRVGHRSYLVRACPDPATGKPGRPVWIDASWLNPGNRVAPEALASGVRLAARKPAAPRVAIGPVARETEKAVAVWMTAVSAEPAPARALVWFPRRVVKDGTVPVSVWGKAWKEGCAQACFQQSERVRMHEQEGENPYCERGDPEDKDGVCPG